MSDAPLPLPAFTSWPTFPFEGDLRVKPLADPVDVEPPRHGEDPSECTACRAPDSAYIWVSERWRVRALDRPTGLPMVLILESRSHLDMGDLPNLLAAELGVLTVRLERSIRSLDGVARVHVNRWGDGSAHLHVWFLARPIGRLQLRGTFLSLWDDILPRIPEQQWRENLALVAEWLADFGGTALAVPPHIDWQSAGEFTLPGSASVEEPASDDGDTTVLADGAPTEMAASDGLTTIEDPTGDARDPQGGQTVLIVSGEPSSSNGETMRIPSGSVSRAKGGSETVNLSEAGSGETMRFPMAAATESANAGATVKFATTAGLGKSSETVVFPTGDAMAADDADDLDEAEDAEDAEDEYDQDDAADPDNATTEDDGPDASAETAVQPRRRIPLKRRRARR